MSKLQEEFNAIIAKIEEKITNEEELSFVKQQIIDVSILYINELNKVIDISEKRVNQVVENQRILEKKQNQIESTLSNMEKEFFIEDNDYDFEIVCPYCNYEFVSDIESDIKEIECPECHNMIELEWNETEEACNGHCSGCHECGEELKEEDEEDDTDSEETGNDEDM